MCATLAFRPRMIERQAMMKSIADIPKSFSHARKGCPSPLHNRHSYFLTIDFDAPVDDDDVAVGAEAFDVASGEWYAFDYLFFDDHVMMQNLICLNCHFQLCRFLKRTSMNQNARYWNCSRRQPYVSTHDCNAANEGRACRLHVCSQYANVSACNLRMERYGMTVSMSLIKSSIDINAR